MDLPKVTARVLADYLGAALLAIDQARVELDWASGWAIVDPAGMPLELTALVEEVLADPLLAPELHELMRLSGVSDSWRAPEVTDPRTLTDHAHVQGVLSPVNVAKTLVVTDSGLLWLKQSWADRFSIALRMNGQEATQLFERYSDMTPEDLAHTRRARMIPWSAVAELRVVPRSRNRVWLVVAVAGGAPLIVKVQKNSQEAGHPWAALVASPRRPVRGRGADAVPGLSFRARAGETRSRSRARRTRASPSRARGSRGWTARGRRGSCPGPPCGRRWRR